MHQSSHAWRLALAAGIALSAFGCSGGSSSTTPAPAAGDFPYKPAPEARSATDHPAAEVIDIIAGQHYDAGDVTITNDGDSVEICFETQDGWKAFGTHLYVGLTPPTKNAPGQFPYKTSYPAGSTGDCFDIPFPAGADCGDTLYIAFHFDLAQFNSEGTKVQTQTGWMEGPYDFPRSWAMYGDYTIAPVCVLPLNLPEDTISASFVHPNGTQSYWQTTLANVPDGTALENGVPYLGWCNDLFHFLSSGATHNVDVYSSLDPALPAHIADSDWDLVNYVINHKQGTFQDIQDAIWFFVGGGGFPADPDAQAMVADAQANGEGFVPSGDDVTAIILDAGTNVQQTFIEVVCECAGEGES